MSIKDITIVITSFKSEKKIRSCLNSIDKQYNVINVENSNDQDYKEKIENRQTKQLWIEPYQIFEYLFGFNFRFFRYLLTL